MGNYGRSLRGGTFWGQLLLRDNLRRLSQFSVQQTLTANPNPGHFTGSFGEAELWSMVGHEMGLSGVWMWPGSSHS